MAACTIAITTAGGFAITIDYFYFAATAEYFIVAGLQL
jgi:hypothetical protein